LEFVIWIEELTQSKIVNPKSKISDRPHPAQSLRAGTAQQMQQHGLGLIAGVMRHRYRLRTDRAGYPCKEAVARRTCRSVQIHALRSRKNRYIGRLDRRRQAPRTRQVGNKHRLIGRFRAANHMIEMRDMQRNAQISA
jgi:hypothetical protein